MAGSKRKAGRKKKRTLKQKASLAAGIFLGAFILLTKVSDALGIMSYDEMFTLLKLRDAPASDSDVSVHFIDVGQGDSIFIKSGDKTVLIDAGEAEYGYDVVSYLREQNVDHLDYVIATHPHSDHIGGLPAVFDQFEVKNVIAPKISDDMIPTTVTYSRFLQAVSDEGTGLTQAKPGDEYDLDGSVLRILGPVTDTYSSLNDFSVVSELINGSDTFLFMGDAGEDSEADLLNAGMVPDCDVLKAGHHGSNTSSSQKFLDAVSPEYAVIMCGIDNKYNHPGQYTMKRLAALTQNIYRTDAQGTIVIESDGSDYNIKTGDK